MSQTNYDRYARVVRLPWLHRAVLDGKIGLTDAAKLAETAEKHKRLAQFEREFAAWATRKQARLDHERGELKKLGRELKGAAAQLKKFLDAATVKAWDASLTQGKPFAEAAANINFGVVIDDAKRTLDLPRVSVSIDKIRSGDVTELMAEFQGSLPALIQLRNRLQLQEQAMELTDEQIQEELLRLQELTRERATKKAEEEAGRDPAEPEVADDSALHDIGAEIDETLRAVNSDAPEAADGAEEDDGDGDAHHEDDVEGAMDDDASENRKD